MSNVGEPFDERKDRLASPLERNMELVTLLRTAYGLGDREDGPAFAPRHGREPHPAYRLVVEPRPSSLSNWEVRNADAK